MHAAVNMPNPAIGQGIDQWYLIAVAINSQNCIKKESWIDSLKRVNMHPYTRSTFDVWIRKLDNRGLISAKTFFEKRTTIYDAMFVCWKKINVYQSQAVMGIICDAYNSTPSNQNVWRKQNILSFFRFVRLEDVFKLRACYLNAKVDPTVIVSLEEEESSNSKNDSASPIDKFCSWKPSDLLSRYQENKTDISIQK